MSWSRRLYRAWVALTVVWLAACLYLVIEYWPQHEPMNFTDEHIKACPEAVEKVDARKPLTKAENDCLNYAAGAEAKLEARVRAHVTRLARVAFIPPVLLVVGGWGLLWMARGFQTLIQGVGRRPNAVDGKV